MNSTVQFGGYCAINILVVKSSAILNSSCPLHFIVKKRLSLFCETQTLSDYWFENVWIWGKIASIFISDKNFCKWVQFVIKVMSLDKMVYVVTLRWPWTELCQSILADSSSVSFLILVWGLLGHRENPLHIYFFFRVCWLCGSEQYLQTVVL